MKRFFPLMHVYKYRRVRLCNAMVMSYVYYFLGVVYLDCCPIEPYIPIFLIVVNVTHSFLGLLLLLLM